MAEPPPDTSADERPLGWGDDDEEGTESAAADERLLADRPPHYDRP